jgi:glycosyltransferase involved in cell wall biosynthesis
MRKKILWISHFLPFPAKGGAQMRSMNLIKQLAAYHDVSLFCIVQENVVKNYYSSLDQALKEAEIVFKSFCLDVEFHIVKSKGRSTKLIDAAKSVFSKDCYAVQRLNSESVREALSKYIHVQQTDYVHIDTVALACFYKIFKDKLIVLNHHNIESSMMYRRAKETNNLAIKIICYLDAYKIKKLELRISKNTSYHLVCSDLDGERLKNLLPKGAHIATIANGIDMSVSQSGRAPDGKSLLFIGGLDWYPNTDAMRFLLNEVWPTLSKKIPDIRLDIIGKCPPEDIIKTCKKYKNITLHGFVDDISSFYRNNWIYICPIRDGGGTKLKVLDAMANGIPLIAHPIAVEGIEAANNVHFLSAANAQDFIETIVDLKVSDQQVLTILSQNARQLMLEKYNYVDIGKRLAAIYC